MPTISVDLSDVSSGVPEPGEYSIIVHEVEVREGDKGPYLNWDLVITEGEWEGRHLYHITSLSEKSLWNLVGFVEALGFEAELMELEYDEETGVLLYPEFVGSVAIAEVYNTTYENRDQARVSALLPIGELIPLAGDDDDEDEDWDDPDEIAAAESEEYWEESEDEEDLEEAEEIELELEGAEEEVEEEEEEPPAKKPRAKKQKKVAPQKKLKLR